MSSSSRLQELWDRHETVWRQLEDLEKRLDESAVRKRRRIANLLDETSTHRLSHLRLFVTHSVSPKNSYQWSLVVEGRLLVGHLDHKSAAQVEREAAEAAGVDIASHIEASSSMTAAASSPSAAGAAGSATDATASSTAAPTPTTTAHSATTAPLVIRSTDRTQYRGISEKEGDVPVEPIQFTHLFDKMTVTFQTIYQPKTQKPAKQEKPKTPTTSKKSRSKKSKRSSKISEEKRNKALEEEELQRLLTTSAVTEVVWNREDSTDAHAFCVNYNSPPPSTTTDMHSVVATISLYPCPGPEDQYQPSPKLAAALFPQHVIYDSSKPTDSKKRKATSSSTTPSKKKRRKTTLDGAASTEEERPDTVADEDVVIPTENDIVVPPKLTLQEIVSALFLYIRDKKLMDESDQSMIVNDKTLENLFECQRMPLAELQERLVSLNLIEKINRHEKPIVLTYIMKQDTASPSPLEKTPVLQQEQELQVPQQQQHDDLVEKKSSEEATLASTKQKYTEEDDEPLHQQSSILSFDMEVHIPGLLHYRARELMRRIKRREFEYTSSRTKARNLLTVSSSRSGGVREDVIKTRIEEAVCGRGFTVDHVPVWLALAKAAPPGSEARMAAQIDARTCVLLDRLEHHCRAAKAAWDIVDACRARGGSIDESR